jgi:ADP-heptose:LPS heptosyltransferase
MLKKLIIKSNLALGDAVVQTASIRDLKRVMPDLRVNILTRPELQPVWDNNPHIDTNLPLSDDEALVIEPVYRPFMDDARKRPAHFIGAYHLAMEKALGVRIPVMSFRPDLHMSAWERRPDVGPAAAAGLAGAYWVIAAGGKTDMTAKWWPWYAHLVASLRNTVTFVQVGRKGDHHPGIPGAVDLRGRTDVRQLFRLVYHSSGVVCPVTSIMHIAAAFPGMLGGYKPAVVISGGREEPHWEAYPGHQLLHTIGQLKCCADRACYKTTAAVVDALSEKRAVNSRCLSLVQHHGLDYAACMEMIKPERVAQQVTMYEELRWKQSHCMSPTEESLVIRSCGTSPPHTEIPRALKS